MLEDFLLNFVAGLASGAFFALAAKNLASLPLIAPSGTEKSVPFLFQEPFPDSAFTRACHRLPKQAALGRAWETTPYIKI